MHYFSVVEIWQLQFELKFVVGQLVFFLFKVGFILFNIVDLDHVLQLVLVPLFIDQILVQQRNRWELLLD